MPSFEYEATNEAGERVISTAFGRSITEVIQALSNKGLQVQRIEDAYAKSDSLRGPVNGQAPPNPATMAFEGATPVVEVTPVLIDHTIPRDVNRDLPSEVPAAPVQNAPLANERPVPNVGQRNYLYTSILGPLVGKVPLRDLSFFFRQFGTMIEAGVPMVQVFDTLAKQSTNGRLKKVLSEMRNAVDAGLPISAVMQRYPEMFSSLMVSMIRAGEEGGFLADASKHISDYLNHDIELKNMYRRETALPKLYVAMSVVIIAITNMILSSLHSNIQLFAPLNEADTWYWLGPLIVGIFLFATVGLANPVIRYYWDLFLLKIPYIGKTVHHFAMAKFGRAFSALYKGGVPVSKSLYLSADASGNEYVRHQIYPAVTKINAGDGISATLAETHVFSPIVLNMMSTGESTGNLDQMILKCAEFYEDEGKVRAKQMAVFIGVMVGILVGVYIGYVVITFWVQVYGGMIQQATDQAFLTGPFLARF